MTRVAALLAIALATVVVADLSANRANCYYELGYADALKRPVVLLCHADTEPEFDVSGRSICRYENAAQLQAELPQWLTETALVNHSPPADDDRNAGRFGRLAVRDGYLLAAELALYDPGEQMWGRVTASVRRVDGKPLPGNAKVRFCLDETLPEPAREGEIVNGVARCVFQSSGAFTLGARVGSTALELDLRHIPGSSDLFRSL